MSVVYTIWQFNFLCYSSAKGNIISLNIISYWFWPRHPLIRRIGPTPEQATDLPILWYFTVFFSCTVDWILTRVVSTQIVYRCFISPQYIFACHVSVWVIPLWSLANFIRNLIIARFRPCKFSSFSLLQLVLVEMVNPSSDLMSSDDLKGSDFETRFACRSAFPWSVILFYLW